MDRLSRFHPYAWSAANSVVGVMMLRNTTVKMKNIGPLNKNAIKANTTSTNKIERMDWRKFIQSAYSIFCPAGAGQAAEDVDIIVRTSAAAIFGYFLSANFIRHTAGQTPASLPPRKLETGKGLPTDPAAPMDRIGFSDGGQAAAPDTAGTADSTPDSSAGNDAANCLQVAVATCIGLFSLVTLHKITDLGSGLNLYRVESLKNRYYIKFPDTLYFNDCMILAQCHYKQKMLFFPISWREEDQVSNTKLTSFAMSLLRMCGQYLTGHKKFVEQEMRTKIIDDYSYQVVASNL